MTQLRNNRQFSKPLGFEMPINIEDTHREVLYESLKSLVWQPQTLSGLEFQLFHWDMPISFTIAYSKLTEGTLFMEAAGFSQPDLLNIMNKLLVLQQSEKLIEHYQAELLARKRGNEQDFDQS
jgi:hypothetical protein